jgi:hypothetical protein
VDGPTTKPQAQPDLKRFNEILRLVCFFCREDGIDRESIAQEVWIKETELLNQNRLPNGRVQNRFIKRQCFDALRRLRCVRATDGTHAKESLGDTTDGLTVSSNELLEKLVATAQLTVNERQALFDKFYATGSKAVNSSDWFYALQKLKSAARQIGAQL